MKKIKLALIPYSVYALIFIVAPILLILLYSFQDTGGAWTLENYARFFDFSDPDTLRSCGAASSWPLSQLSSA